MTSETAGALGSGVLLSKTQPQAELVITRRPAGLIGACRVRQTREVFSGVFIEVGSVTHL